MITVVSGIPGSGTSLMIRVLEAGGMPTLETESPYAETDFARFQPAVKASERLHQNATWFAAAEGKVCRIPSGHLFDLPANREFRIIYMLRDLDAIMTLNYSPQSPGSQTDNSLPPEMLRHRLDQHLGKIFRWLNGPRRIAALECQYNELMDQPMAIAREIVDFLGLRLNTSAMAATVEHERLHNKNVSP